MVTAITIIAKSKKAETNSFAHTNRKMQMYFVNFYARTRWIAILSKVTQTPNGYSGFVYLPLDVNTFCARTGISICYVFSSQFNLIFRFLFQRRTDDGYVFFYFKFIFVLFVRQAIYCFRFLMECLWLFKYVCFARSIRYFSIADRAWGASKANFCSHTFLLDLINGHKNTIRFQ